MIMEYKVTLSIGYPGADHQDILEVDDEDLSGCQTEESKADLIQQYAIEWANNYIEVWTEPVD